MVRIFQTALSAGEIAPELFAREDLQKFGAGARRIRNFVVDFRGGAFNRPGFQYIKNAHDESKPVRLIEMEFSTVQNYVLEFGHLYMRVFKDGGIVLEPALAIAKATQTDPVEVTTTVPHGLGDGDEVFITGVGGMTELNGRFFTVANAITDTFELVGEDGTGHGAYSGGGTAARIFVLPSPYAADELDRLKFVQSADVMFLAHQAHKPMQLTRTDHHLWTLSEIKFTPSIKPPSGVTVTPATSGGEEYRYRVTAVKSESLEESLPGTGDTVAIEAASQTDPVRITATAHPLGEGDEVEISGVVGMSELNGRRFRAANVLTDSFDLEGEDGTGHGAYVSGGTAARTFALTVAAASLSASNPIDITWTAPALGPDDGSVERYNVYREDNGIFGFVGATEDLIFVDENVQPDVSDTPPKARNPFLLPNNYPGTVAFHEQRSVWGATFKEPQKTWMSQTADFKNLSVSNPTKDDDAVTYTIAARKVNEIRHFVSLADLIILTRGAVWRANAGDGPAITPTSIDVKPQSEDGAAHLAPIVAGNAILFVEDGGDVVRELGYSLQVDGYVGEDVTQMAPHIFRSASIVDWAYAPKPHRVVWAALDDGTLAALTYARSQDVFAWSTHDTAGHVESLAAIREGRDDVVYAVVRRTVGGVERRYIERMRERRLASVKDAFMVDSGLSYDQPMAIAAIAAANTVAVTTAGPHGLSNGAEVDLDDIIAAAAGDGETDMAAALNGARFVVQNVTATGFELADLADGTPVDGSAFSAYRGGGVAREPASVVAGLDHLEGEAVAILADGDVMPVQTVSGGTVTVGQNASRIHVGLPYVAEIETLPPALANVWGRKKAISAVTLVVASARGLLVGRAGAALVPVERRSTEPWDDPIGLHTGIEEVAVHSGWDANAGIVIRQVDPVPASVLGIISDVDVGG